jgi:DNA-binding MarR family transcriptional regulator
MAKCIVLRYTISVRARITADKYRALAELRYRIRRFLRDGDAAARAVGLKPQQYLMLLSIRGLPQGGEATIRTLASLVALKHHSTVELIDRLEMHGYVRRSRRGDDWRLVMV